jgi:hypothetical protein
VERVAMVGLLTMLLLAVTSTSVLAHGDVPLVDESLVLAPGTSASFDGDLHYHRLVGEVIGDGAIRVRLVESRTAAEVLTFGPGTRLSFNELVRCCDEPWTPHTLVIENVSRTHVAVTARASLIHDDLAVMVDGAESGTRVAIVVLALVWSGAVWQATRRHHAGPSLRGSTLGLALLTILVLGSGTYAMIRYGTPGAPSVVAGNADVPVLPMNPVVSRASLLMGSSMLGWALVGVWWVRARDRAARIPWTVLGIVLAGAALIVAVAVLVAYGGLLVQAAWLVAAVGPIVVVLVTSSTSSRRRPTEARSLTPDLP